MALCRAGRTGACIFSACAPSDWHTGCRQQHFLCQDCNSLALKSAYIESCRSCTAYKGCPCHLGKQVVSPVSGCLKGTPHCRPVLDEKNLPEVTACGLNMPCPDLLTPQRAAGAIWTWAPGQPYDADWSRDWQAGWMQYLLRLWRPLHKRLELQVRLDSILCRGSAQPADPASWLQLLLQQVLCAVLRSGDEKPECCCHTMSRHNHDVQNQNPPQIPM